MNFKKLVKPYENLLLTSLKDFVEINSVYDESTVSTKQPYGKGICYALKRFGDLGEIYGFNVERDSHYTELSIGESGPLIEIYGHLDVVPIKSLKNRNPFSLHEENGKLFGRGTADDKGPLLAAFYAVKALKDNGLINNARIKIFAGGDEERGSSCLNYYVHQKKKEMPDYGFTPDSSFPLVYGEKGSAVIVVKKKIRFKNIKNISGGLAPNIVIQECEFVVDNIEEIKNNLTGQFKVKDNRILFIGTSAHGSKPELGINAFLEGLKLLAKINSDQDALNLTESFLDYSGRKINSYFETDGLKGTVFNIGKVNYEHDELTLTINYRYPEKPKPQEITKNVLNFLNAELIYESYAKPLLFELNSPLITSLIDAYNKETKQTAKPLISGGGTYAKEVENTVAFGAEPPNVNYKMHEDDEFINKKDLILAMGIYAHAIYNLINLK